MIAALQQIPFEDEFQADSSYPVMQVVQNIKTVVTQTMQSARIIWDDTEVDEPDKELMIKTLARSAGIPYEDVHKRLLNDDEYYKPFVTIDAVDLQHDGSKGREWLVAGLLPTSTSSILYAKGGVGKSFLIYNLALCIGSGKSWNGFRTKRGKVLIVQTDEARADTKERLCIADFEKHVGKGWVQINQDWQFTRIRQLEQWIKENRPAYVVIDSLTSANINSIANENDPTYAICLKKIADLADRYECHIMVLHHEAKAGDLRGSTAIRNTVSEIYHLRNLKPPEIKFLEISSRKAKDLRVLESDKSRSGVDTIYTLEFDKSENNWRYMKDSEDGTPIDGKLLKWLEVSPDLSFTATQLQADATPSETIKEVFNTLCFLARKGLIDRIKNINSLGKQDDLFMCPKSEENTRLSEVRSMLLNCYTVDDFIKCRAMVTRDEVAEVWETVSHETHKRLNDLKKQLESQKVIELPVDYKEAEATDIPEVKQSETEEFNAECIEDLTKTYLPIYYECKTIEDVRQVMSKFEFSSGSYCQGVDLIREIEAFERKNSESVDVDSGQGLLNIEGIGSPAKVDVKPVYAMEDDDDEF